MEKKMKAFILGQTSCFSWLKVSICSFSLITVEKMFQVNTEQLFCFPNELKNPLGSQLYLQYLCYSAPEVPYGAVSKTQDRRQIKLYFFMCFLLL